MNQFLEALPIGVMVFSANRKKVYVNQYIHKILDNPERGILADVKAGRTLDETRDFFSLHLAGTSQPYPVDKLPIASALQGESDYADDIAADLTDRKVPLEMWARPVFSDSGKVEYAVAAIIDISARKQMEEFLRRQRETTCRDTGERRRSDYFNRRKYANKPVQS